MKFFPISMSASQNFSSDVSSQDLPSVLFERTAKMEGLQKEFAKVLLLPKKKRDKWVKNHQDFIQDMLDKIRQESSIMVKDFATNDLTKSTITEYMVTVQQTLATLEKVVYENQESEVD